MTMIEKVARALYAEEWDDKSSESWEEADEDERAAWLKSAKVAIKAMRDVEPNDTMMSAVWSMRAANTRDSFKTCWQSMLDAIIEDQP